MDPGARDWRWDVSRERGKRGALKKGLFVGEGAVWGVVYHGSCQSSMGKAAEMILRVPGGSRRPDWIER